MKKPDVQKTGFERAMGIREATHEFERWLATHTSVVRSQLTQKHEKMAEDPFIFLRGTIYRWAQIWWALCPETRQGSSPAGRRRLACRELWNLA